MRPAGNYLTRLLWRVNTPTLNPADGEMVDSFPDLDSDDPGDYLFAGVEEVGGRDAQEYGARETGATVEIRVRGFPPIKVIDRLYDEQYGYEYHIDSIYLGNGETVCDCHRYDELEI